MLEWTLEREVKSSCWFATAEVANSMYWNEQAFGITSRLVENEVFAFLEMHKSSLQNLQENACRLKMNSNIYDATLAITNYIHNSYFPRIIFNIFLHILAPNKLQDVCMFSIYPD